MPIADRSPGACDHGPTKLDGRAIGMPVLAGAEPFRHTGSTETGVLLCHGFTGTPATMRPWGEYLADAGYTVSCPRLPGHGTTWQECNRTEWTDWYACVEAEFHRLAQECESVFVFGLSMGGTLTLRLAEQLGDAVAGIALVNPSVLTTRLDAKFLPLLSRVLPSAKGLAGDIARPGVTELAYDRTPCAPPTVSASCGRWCGGIWPRSPSHCCSRIRRSTTSSSRSTRASSPRGSAAHTSRRWCCTTASTSPPSTTTHRCCSNAVPTSYGPSGR
ncbi:alpha/beta hydrolase [Prauserella oleivorans]